MRALVPPALLLVTLSAFAAAPLTFEEVDTDGDGLISADEAANVEGLDFNVADGDKDGTLSVDEYEIAVEQLSPPAETTATPAPPATGAAQPGASVTPASPPTKIDAPKPAESTLSVKPAAPPTPPKP